jgi:TPR repeat protein
MEQKNIISNEQNASVEEVTPTFSQEVVEWYERGMKFYEGKVMRPDSEKAVEYFEKAAKHGLPEAQSQLAYCICNGIGVERDYALGAEWYRKAAEQGYAEAQYRLGNCYFYGLGLEADMEEAEQWYLRAADNGVESAKGKLNELKNVVERKAIEESEEKTEKLGFWGTVKTVLAVVLNMALAILLLPIQLCINILTPVFKISFYILLIPFCLVAVLYEGIKSFFKKKIR